MNADPMIGGKTRAEWDIETAPLLARCKEQATRAAYRNAVIASVLLMTFAWFGQHYCHTHYFHEVLAYVLLGWFGHGMYLYGKSASK